MSFEAALKDELSAIPALNGKVFPLNAPEGTITPFLVYVSSEGLPDKSLNGYMTTKEISGELNIIHDTYDSLKPLVASVIAIIQSFQGRVIGTNGPLVEDLTYEQPVELFEPEIKKYRCNISFQVRI